MNRVKASGRGLLDALWWVVRTLSSALLAFIAVGWATLSTSPPGGDGTPLYSFVIVVVAPLAGVVIVGVVTDVWVASQPNNVAKRATRVVTAIISVLILFGVLLGIEL